MVEGCWELTILEALRRGPVAGLRTSAHHASTAAVRRPPAARHEPPSGSASSQTTHPHHGLTMPLMRIPYTEPLPLGKTLPSAATTPARAVAALAAFLSAPHTRNARRGAVLLTGAGISVASGLADYRGAKGTYTLNKTYRPIYFHEFAVNHEARKRYWARSFLGWTTLHKAQPNSAHWAIKSLGDMGLVNNVITQSQSPL